MMFCKDLYQSIISIYIENFLSYHPNISARGEIHFFENDRLYEKGLQSYLMKMPLTSKGQIVLTKSAAVWYQNDVNKVLERHKSNSKKFN